MNKLLRVTAPGPTGWGTRIETADGAKVPGIRSCRINIEPDDIIIAEIDIVVEAVDVMVHPLLGLETIRAAALAHGYELTALGDAA